MGKDKIALSICFCLIVALAGFSALLYLGAKGLESRVSGLESRTSNLEAQNAELNEKVQNYANELASEQLQLGNPWGWNCAAGTVNINLTNSGGGTVVITAARVGDSSASMSVTWSSDTTTTGANLAAGERACIQITRGSAFTAGVPYTFTIVTQRNNEFQTTGTAQAP